MSGKVTEPRFTILLPTHNRAATLAVAIASVQAQSLVEWELLVVGDGCTDDTASLMAGFAGDARIRWFDLPKAEGFGYANRNRVLAEARGELVAFLGHDNVYFPDHLERLAGPLRDPQAMMAYSRPLLIGDDGAIVPFFVNLTTPPARRAFLTKANVLPASTVVYRRTALAGPEGPWPEDRAHSGDWEMWKRIAEAHPQGLRPLREPTCLHFRADWRPAARWAPPPYALLRLLQEAGAWYPPELLLRMPEGVLPQAAVWARIEADPTLTLRIRNACDRLLDHLAWTAGLHPAFG